MDHGMQLERRLGVMEDALLGDPRPGGNPGLLEIQRAQSSDIKDLKLAVERVSHKVDSMAKARDGEIAVRQGEQRMLRTFRNIAYALLILVGAGGSIMGSRILAVLNSLRP